MQVNKIKKLTELIHQREDLCSIQSKAVSQHYTLSFSFEGNYGYVGNYKILPELEERLKLEVQKFYEEKINEITEEIQKLCQEQ